MVTRLKVHDAACGYGARTVIEGISFDVASGEVLCLLGPNGVGKTTLFKTLLGFLPLKAGSMTVDGEDLRSWSRKRFAQVIGYVPQAHTPPFPFRAEQVVLMGRTAHLGTFATPSAKDVAIAAEAMERLGISHLADKVYTEISGGERQMVLIARALTQRPKLLVMDEPTSNLDFGNQMRVLSQVNALAESGLGVVMTTHVPDHAFWCGSKVALMRPGGFDIGTPLETVTEDSLRQVYGVDVKLTQTRLADGRIARGCVPLLT